MVSTKNNSPKEKQHELIYISLRFFIYEMWLLIKSPVFILLTIIGNIAISLFSALFYFMEKGSNLKIKSFLDALWWGMATATTTGYGDITATTISGKILGMLLMLTGLAFFAMFTALFAETILNSTKHPRN